MYGIIVSGGTVVDGSGGPSFPADVGIEDGRIATIGDLSQSETGRVVDARYHAVSPEFIDTATCDIPRQFPIDNPYGRVDGEVTVHNDQCTGVLAGREIP